MFTRTRFQDGCLQLKERRDGRVWEFRYYEPGPDGCRERRTIIIGSDQEYPSESAARRSPKVQAALLRVNADGPSPSHTVPVLGDLLARYQEEEIPERYSTRIAYESYIARHIRPRWAETPLNLVKPMAVEHWLKTMDLAPKTKAHIKSLMHTLFRCAERWELVDRNPITLVRVKGGTKRLRTPRVLTPEQFNSLLSLIGEPFRTMVLVAGCLGLRVSEIVALQWRDIDFENNAVLVRRSVVHGRVDDVKTEYSRDQVPLDPTLASFLDDHKQRCVPTSEGWLFANPVTGRPYHQEQIQKRHIRRAGKEAGIADDLGWHTFRHSYRSWLDEAGAPISVQKELMRHASIQTTMNVYGRAMTDTKRAANSKVVHMVMNKAEAKAKPGGSLKANGS